MKELTKGSPLELLLLFSLPILLGNILQQFYNLGDTVIVGRTLGIRELAAVGAVSFIVELLFSLISGFTTGFSILTGNAFGAGDEERVRQVIAKSLLLCGVIVVFLTAAGLIFIRPLLLLLHTPADIIGDSLVYIRILFFGIIITMTYNLIASMLRALGDSIFPLIALAISSLLNLALDLILIKVFHMGIRGAAIATVFAQFISVVVCLVYIVKKCPLLHIRREHFVSSDIAISDLFVSGAGMALMYSIVSIGSIILQSGINSLGTDIIAAHTASRKILSFSIMPFATMSSSLVTFTSQNMGAQKPERVKEAVLKSILLGLVWGLIAMTVIYTFGGQLVNVITKSQSSTVTATAVKYLRININLPFFAFLTALCFFRSTLQGLGQKVVPICASLIEMVGKAVIAFTLVPKLGYTAVCICEPVLWIICCLIVTAPMIKFLKTAT